MAKAPVLLAILILLGPVAEADTGRDCPEAPGASSNDVPPTCAYAGTSPDEGQLVAESAPPTGDVALTARVPAPTPPTVETPRAPAIPAAPSPSVAVPQVQLAQPSFPSGAASLHVEPAALVPATTIAASADTPAGRAGARVGERATRDATGPGTSVASDPVPDSGSQAAHAADTARATPAPSPVDRPAPDAPGRAGSAPPAPVVPLAVATRPAPVAPERVNAWTAAGGVALFAIVQFLAALYHRINGADATRQGTRARLLAELATGPATATQLGQRLGIDRTSAAHHLRVLRRCGFVACANAGRERLWALAPARLDPLGAGARRVLDAVRAAPGSSLSDVARAIGASKSTVHHHVLSLAAADLLRVERRGRALALDPAAPKAGEG